jgi:hypothetical protein
MVYENAELYTVKKGCPWYEMQQTFSPPNVNWCEPTYCQLISEPSNTWSNLGMIIPGIIICYLSRQLKSPMIKKLGFCIVAMGLCSFVYHATNNYLTQFLDLMGIYLYAGALITINILRLNKSYLGREKQVFIFVLFIIISIFWLFHFSNLPIQLCVVLNIIILLAQEWKARSSSVNYKYFWPNLLFVAIAQAFSLLDYTRIWCNPTNLVLHGHALWHFFAGVSSVFAYLYYKQFDKDLVQEG